MLSSSVSAHDVPATSPATTDPSSVSVMSYDGTVLSEKKLKQTTVEGVTTTCSSNKENVKTNLILPSKPQMPNRRAASTSSIEKRSKTKNEFATGSRSDQGDDVKKTSLSVPKKSVFVPGSGWASQVCCYSLKFTFTQFRSRDNSSNRSLSCYLRTLASILDCQKLHKDSLPIKSAHDLMGTTNQSG